jgi:dipeptidyl aminopeptidase/acylaminoacyl peptidase
MLEFEGLYVYSCRKSSRLAFLDGEFPMCSAIRTLQVAKNAFVVVFISITSISMFAATTDSKPLSADAILSAVEFADRVPLALSPDGKVLAYSLVSSRRRELHAQTKTADFTDSGVPFEWAYTEIWITEIDSGHSKRIIDATSSWGPVWSPDSRRLAFYSDKSGQVQLWIWNRDTSELRRVSDALTHSFFGFEIPQWSRDGKQLLVKLLPEGMTLSESSKLLGGAATAPPSKDGSSGSTARILRSKTESPASSGSDDAWTNEELADLSLIDVTGAPKAHRLARRQKIRGYWLSPDSNHVVFTVLKSAHGTGKGTITYDLVITSVNTEKSQVLATNLVMAYGLNVSWSPDGRWLSFVSVTPRNQDQSSKRGECFFISVPDGKVMKALSTDHPDFRHDYRPPAWNSSSTAVFLIGSNEVWKIDVATLTATRVAAIPDRVITEFISMGPGRVAEPDANSLLVRTYATKTSLSGFYSIDLESGSSYALREEEKWYGRGDEALYDMVATSKAHVLIFGAEDAQHCRDLYVSTDQFKTVRQITNTNPPFQPSLLGRSRMVEYVSDDGQPLRGALLLPAGYRQGTRYPLLTWVYGGGLGSSRINRFGLVGSTVDNMQFFATRGYAVFFPDAPLRLGSPMEDLAKTVLPGIRRLIALEIVDPERIGIMGHSYGGYSVLCLISQSNIFKAAMASAAAGNLISMYSHLQASGDSFGIRWAEQGQGLMGGNPWEFRERYIGNSPFFYLDKVETPLLLIHGMDDDLVPPYLAEDVFVALRRLGKDAVLAEYQDEKHWEGEWSYINQLDYLERVLSWFDRHLKSSAKGR